jgi:hypothetical protein
MKVTLLPLKQFLAQRKKLTNAKHQTKKVASKLIQPSKKNNQTGLKALTNN